jgi:hypothetical protein
LKIWKPSSSAWRGRWLWPKTTASASGEPAFGGSCVMHHRHDLAAELNLERRGQRALKRLLVDVAVDGVDERT